MGGKKGFNKLLGYMEANKNKTKLAVVMGQEHNTKKSEFQDLKDAAQIRGFQLIITAGYADNTQSLRGGVFIMINTNVLSVKKIVEEEAGFIRVKLDWGSEELDIANVYAPAKPAGRLEYYNTLRARLDKTTIVGGDWNTVGDKTLDVRSRDPLAYPNIGSSLLGQIMGDLGLVDERREQLGQEREYTRTGPSAGGGKNYQHAPR